MPIIGFGRTCTTPRPGAAMRFYLKLTVIDDVLIVAFKEL